MIHGNKIWVPLWCTINLHIENTCKHPHHSHHGFTLIMIPFKAKATLNPFCSGALLTIVCIITSAYRARCIVITAVCCLINSLFVFCGCNHRALVTGSRWINIRIPWRWYGVAGTGTAATGWTSFRIHCVFLRVVLTLDASQVGICRIGSSGIFSLIFLISKYSLAFIKFSFRVDHGTFNYLEALYTVQSYCKTFLTASSTALLS